MYSTASKAPPVHARYRMVPKNKRMTLKQHISDMTREQRERVMLSDVLRACDSTMTLPDIIVVTVNKKICRHRYTHVYSL